jgi:hypothetical protein
MFAAALPDEPRRSTNLAHQRTALVQKEPGQQALRPKSDRIQEDTVERRVAQLLLDRQPPIT